MKRIMMCSNCPYVLVARPQLVRMKLAVKVDCLSDLQRHILMYESVNEAFVTCQGGGTQAYVCTDTLLEGKVAFDFFSDLEKYMGWNILTFLLPSTYIMLSSMPSDQTQLPNLSIGYTKNRKVAHKSQLVKDILKSSAPNEGLIFLNTECDVAFHINTKGLIGMLVIDRDAHLIPLVFEGLGKALELIAECEVDILVSLRPSEGNARKACLSHCPKGLRIIFKAQE